MFKRAVAYIFVVIFVFNTIGYFVAFTTLEYQLKTRVRATLDQGVNPDKIVAIVVEKNELKNIEWIEEGKEMLFNNQRYDVINNSTDKHTITFYCVHDREETALYADLENHVDSYVVVNKPFKSGALKKSLEKELKFFFENNPPFISLNFTEKRLPVYSSAIFYHPPPISPSLPPPKPSRI